MEEYPKLVEDQMVKFFRSLNERDRRRYAAVEAAKLGHGGIVCFAVTGLRSEDHWSWNR